MKARKRYPGGAATDLRYIDATISRVERRDAQGEAKYEIAISSETVVERSFFGLVWREQLSHEDGAVQLSRLKSGRAAFLADHDDTRQIGTLKMARLDSDKVVRAEVAWGVSQLAQERKAEIDAGTGVGTNISVGYLPKRWRLIEEDEEKGDLWLSTLWEPVEASSVAIPADSSVGFGRSRTEPQFYPIEVEEPEGRTMGNGTRVEPRDRNAEIAEIHELCEASGVPVNREWIAEDLTPDQVGRRILKEQGTRSACQPAAENLLDGLSARDRGRYSYARGLLCAAGIERGGLEAEVDQALSRRYPARRGSAYSILVPTRVGRGPSGWSTRGALDTKTPHGAAEAIFDTPGEFIDLYRAAAMVIRAGARVITGLVGNVGHVKKTGAATVHWVSENPGSDVAESEVEVGIIMSSPHTLQGTTAFSRQFLVQAPSGGVDAENLVRSDLAEGHALALDLAALHGSGVGPEPAGLYAIDEVLSDTGIGVPAWDDLTKAVGAIGDANAPTDTLSWITHPLLAAKLLATLVASSAGSDMIWQGRLTNGSMVGYPAFATGQASKTLGAGGNEIGLVLGRWSEMLLNHWGVLEVIVDPYALKKRGLIEVTTFELADIVVRQPTAFWRGEGVTLS